MIHHFKTTCKDLINKPYIYSNDADWEIEELLINWHINYDIQSFGECNSTCKLDGIKILLSRQIDDGNSLDGEPLSKTELYDISEFEIKFDDVFIIENNRMLSSVEIFVNKKLIELY